MGLTYSTKRELNSGWLDKVLSWLEETGEVLVYLRYLFNSPTMRFALIRSERDLRRLVDISPEGTELTACKGVWLPVRGVVGVELLAQVRDEIPPTTDCVCVFTRSHSPDGLVLDGTSWCTVLEMIGELAEHEGEEVAIGVFLDNGRETISAAIGGLDGPR